MEYVWQGIADSPDLELQVICTGSHLDPQRGRTLSEILSRGFNVNTTIDLQMRHYTSSDVAAATGLALQKFAESFTLLSPDVVIVTGDRYEMFAAAAAAMLLGIPIAHVFGGELTVGAVDDSIRHATTKMAQIHFVTAPEYARRVIQMGEDPQLVFDVGSPALCLLERETLPDLRLVANEFGLKLTRPYLVVTYHPETLGIASHGAAVSELLEALQECSEFHIVITGVNADAGSADVSLMLQRFAQQQAHRVNMVESLGHRNFLALVQGSTACVGNSSSGLLEAPALRVPTVNIGGRQQGRIRAPSVIDVPADSTAISAAIRLAASPDFLARIDWEASPHVPRGASRQIVQVLHDIELEGLTRKRFMDLDAPDIGKG